MTPIIAGSLAALGTVFLFGGKKAAATAPAAAPTHAAAQTALQKQLAVGATTGNPIANQLKPNLPNLPSVTVRPAATVASSAPVPAPNPVVIGAGTIAPHLAAAPPPVRIINPVPSAKLVDRAPQVFGTRYGGRSSGL